MSNLLVSIRGIVVSLLLFINLIFFALITLLVAGLAWFIPIPRWHHAVMQFAHQPPILWMWMNVRIMKISSHGKWDVQGVGDLNPKGLYILISNHQSWADIIVLGGAFNRRVPLLKFFMKKSLLWKLPVAGLACWMLDYPFMARHSREQLRKNPELKGKDIETAKKACEKFKHYPTTVMNFVEGTRFSQEKKQKQNSSYHYLLTPKTAGVAVVLNEIHEQMDGIINATINYSQKPMGMWDFVCGRFDRVSVLYELLPVTHDLIGDYYNDRDYRKHFRNWLNDLWLRKDALISKLSQHSEKKNER